MGNELSIIVSDELRRKLDQTSKKTGLNLSEICRRGILREIQSLNGDFNGD